MKLLQYIKCILSPIYHSLMYPKKALRYRKIMANPKQYVNEIYYAMNLRDIDWYQPTDLNEVIQWLKMYGDTSQWSLYADKYRVREYVSSKGLENMLIPIIGVWKHVWNIPWRELPNQCVIKPNNGSANVIICKDKNALNKLKLYSNGLIQEHRKYGYANYEPHYMQIKPCIIVEELLDVTKQAVPSTSLIDYKIYCINGEPKYVWVVTNRTASSCETSIYDLEWCSHNEYLRESPHYHVSKIEVPKPRTLDTMLDAAKRLSEGMPFVRVDLYEVDGHTYFGEMTMTPAGGFIDFHTIEFLQALGKEVRLQK